MQTQRLVSIQIMKAIGSDLDKDYLLRRSSAIYSLKGIAIIGVVLIHLPHSKIFDDNSWAILQSIQYCFDWSVLAFFFASGCVDANASTESWKDKSTYVVRRANRLLLPFAIFSLAYKTALILFSELGYIEKELHAFPNSFFGWVEFLLGPAPPQFYFLPLLFAIQVSAKLLRPYFDSALPETAILFTIAPLMGVLGFRVDQPLHGPHYSLYLLYAGTYIAGLYEIQASKKHFIRFLIMWSVVAGFTGALQGGLLKGVSVVTPLWIFCLLCQTECTHLSKVLNYLGARSGRIYVWHAPILISIVTAFFSFTTLAPLLVAFFSVITTVCISIGVGELVSKLNVLRPIWM